MNRHGYNGLCRYNLKGGYNVPFGRYKKPYYPEKELWNFAEKSQKATFTNHCFRKTFESTKRGDVIYCDPPYAPLSPTASFTSYSGQGFKLKDQEELALLAERASADNIPVLISNHDLELTRRLYQGAQLTEIQVKRTISQKAGKRLKVGELLALY
jgi:DNA adenine methylase